jgi:hypothetical protein
MLGGYIGGEDIWGRGEGKLKKLKRAPKSLHRLYLLV